MDKIDISDTLIERPVSFCYKRRRYSILPLSLGKLQLCLRLIQALGLDKIKRDGELYSLALKSAQNRRNECLRLMSYITLPGADCLDETLVRDRVKRFGGMRVRDLATVLAMFMTMDRTEEIMREFSIDKESERLSEALRVKSESKDNGSVSFGGRSIWGTMIDTACERYGWTYQYVLWGISFSALQLLLADHIKTVFLTEDERKRAPRLVSGPVINASDNDSLKELIKTQSWK